MSKIKKCPMCKNNVAPTAQDFSSGKTNARTKEEIVVKDVAIYSCTNSDCEHRWMPIAEEQRIDCEIATLSRLDLNRDDIILLRKALGFKTKSQASKFLCLNEKAFTKWELGYSEPNRAYDLLLRLAAFSKDNFNFINDLHKEYFIFEPNKYELINNYVSLTTEKNQASDLASYSKFLKKNAGVSMPNYCKSHLYSQQGEMVVKQEEHGSKEEGGAECVAIAA